MRQEETTDAPPHPETMKPRKQTEPSRRRNDNPRSRIRAAAIIHSSPFAADAADLAR